MPDVNLDEIEKLAREVDVVNQQADAKPVKKGKRGSSEPAQAPEPEPEPIPFDPHFEMMIVRASSMGVDWMKEKFDLMEPGGLTRQEMGACISRFLQRIKPIQPGPLGDLFTLGGYLGVWVIFGRNDHGNETNGSNGATSG